MKPNLPENEKKNQLFIMKKIRSNYLTLLKSFNSKFRMHETFKA